MTITQTIDLYVWKYLVPKIRTSWFESGFMSAVSLIYISLFPLPRKFLLHYLSAKGTKVEVETEDVLRNNPLVMEKIRQEIWKKKLNGEKNGMLKIPQYLVDQANHRYSIGSFSVHYEIENERVGLRILSDYHFGKDPDRITRYVHRRMFALKEKGKASDFLVKGNEWRMTFEQLSSIKTENRGRIIKRDRLYM